MQGCASFFDGTGANRKQVKHCFAPVSGLAPWGDRPGRSCIAAGSRRKIPAAQWTRGMRYRGHGGRGVSTSHSAVGKHLSWLLLFVRAKRSNQVGYGQGHDPSGGARRPLRPGCQGDGARSASRRQVRLLAPVPRHCPARAAHGWNASRNRAGPRATAQFPHDRAGGRPAGKPDHRHPPRASIQAPRHGLAATSSASIGCRTTGAVRMTGP